MVLARVGEGEAGEGYAGVLQTRVIGGVSGIVWRPALQAAILLAVPASVLCTALSGLGFLVMAAAAAWAVHMYGRRVRTTGLSTGTGARIGLVTGLMTSWLSIGFYGCFMWLARFLLHQGSAIDSKWATLIVKPFDEKQLNMVQNGTANADSIAFAHRMRDVLLSTNGKAAFTLASLCTLTALFTFFAVIGGALGARLSASGRRAGT